MLRIHLAQVFFNPAYFEAPIDYLEETTFLAEADAALGTLRSIDAVQSILSDFKGAYLAHILSKLPAIVAWSLSRKADILVLPEYSVPWQCLATLQARIKGTSTTLIAGSHKVAATNEARAAYSLLLPDHVSPSIGSACVPVLSPDGTAHLVPKLHESKWEHLNCPTEPAAPFLLTRQDGAVQVAVLPCIDSLHTSALQRYWPSDASKVHLLVCPPLSPSTEPFRGTSTLAVLNEVLFAFSNSASFGGTSFGLPEAWTPFLSGARPAITSLPPLVEAVLELDCDPPASYAQ